MSNIRWKLKFLFRCKRIGICLLKSIKSKYVSDQVPDNII